MLIINSYVPPQQQAIVQLWRDCGLVRPWNDPALDIERKLAVAADLFLVGTVKNEVVGTVMGGYDGHRGWVNYVAVASHWRGHGFGRQLMQAIERKLIARGCPKLNLQVRSDNSEAIKFYETLGYKVDAVVSMGKRLIPDN